MSERNGHARRIDPEVEAAQRADIVAGCLKRLGAQLGYLYAEERVGLGDGQYVVYHRAQPAALRRVRKIAAGMGEFVRDRYGLVLYGTVGTGKDHFLAALLYAAARAGASCAWLGATQLRGAEKVVAPRIEAALRPRVLGFSDPIPPAGDPAHWHLERFYDLLDQRVRLGRVTWATMNADSEEAAREALTAAVWSRLARHPAAIIPCFWPDFRARRARGETPCQPAGSTATPTAPTGTAPGPTSPPPPR
jgi:hypothetical protein